MLTYVAFRVITLLYILVVAATIVVVILEKRQPVKTMAWTLVLITLPVAGLLLFYFFGQDIRKERRYRRREIRMLMRRALSHYLPLERVDIPAAYKPLADFFVGRTYAAAYSLGSVDIFTDGENKLTAMLRDIARAKSHINVEYFIFDDDAVGWLVRDFLVDAVGRGVTVRLLYDDVGCWAVKNRFFSDMAKAGIVVQAFMPVRFAMLTRRVNYRNHRKIMVVDGRVGYIGGMNIARRYLYGYHGEGWRDMHLRLTGDAALGLQQTFVSDWYYNSDELLSAPDLFPAPEKQARISPGALQIVSASPASEMPYIMNGFVWAILNAKRYFYLATPYLMPTEQVLNALQTAAGAGVDVRIMVPARAEHRWLRIANESYYGDVMRAGAKVYAYTPSFMHAKYFVSDDALSTVGSTNTDFRSFEDDFEVNAFIYDSATAQRLRQCFERDMLACREVGGEEWERRGRMQRLAESFVRIFSPLL